jgi:hypothetical protein
MNGWVEVCGTVSEGVCGGRGADCTWVLPFAGVVIDVRQPFDCHDFGKRDPMPDAELLAICIACELTVRCDGGRGGGVGPEVTSSTCAAIKAARPTVATCTGGPWARQLDVRISKGYAVDAWNVP